MRTFGYFLAGLAIIGVAVTVMAIVGSPHDGGGLRVAEPPPPPPGTLTLPTFPLGKPLVADRDLPRTLRQLDAVIRREHPDLYGRFRPGLSQAEIDRLSAKLAPYRLPKELVTLYRWHDGWDEFLDGTLSELVPEDTFSSLSEAVDEYESWKAGVGGGWNPLWFPFVGSEYGQMVPLQRASGKPAGQVYSFDAEDDLWTSYDSLGSYFGTVLDYWRTGVMDRYDPGRITQDVKNEMVRIAVLHNPRSRRGNGLERRTISRDATGHWPAAWKRAIGLGPLLPAAEGDLVTVDDVRADPSLKGPIRVELIPSAGYGDDTIAEAKDDTGSLTVVIRDGETVNARELLGDSSRFDVWLRPVEAGYDKKLAETMLASTGAVPVAFVATRIVPVDR
jgi:cell wall assembly regulator SMI1